MFNRPNRSDVDDGVQDIQNDVNQLADSLEAVLKSWGSDAKGEAEEARRKAKSLLKETRARLHGRAPSHQAARDAVSCASTYVKENPVYALGAVAAVGIFLGALICNRR
ncbi:DUF883 family protein [Metakosakonia massiliensis]|uniref:DUF883 domain-containing protein n=1 Tax=Phytobacter massiliensis TaxID=1485952 RepID=A0A6N3AWD5_9ENTR|nr:DUF883 family protein [Phytobacter massiliensis]